MSYNNYKMGISGYLKNLSHEHVVNKTFDTVYIDCNYMLHYLIYKCKSDNDLYDKLYNYCKYLFDNVKIKYNIYLIFDGEGIDVINPKNETQITRQKYKKVSDDYDKQVIKPKSAIINTFKTYFVNIINTFKKIYKSNFNVNVNDDYVQDEADYKILNYLHNSNDNENICIISRDSDMILIAYNTVIKKNVYIDIITILRPLMYVDVNKLVEKYHDSDYILAILLLGNDYLPKISNVDYNVIINNYCKYKKHGCEKIINNDDINYTSLVEFITYIVVDKKIKLNIGKINYDRFNTYFNNLLWCLKKYNITNNDNTYSNDTLNVVNIYNFIYHPFRVSNL